MPSDILGPVERLAPKHHNSSRISVEAAKLALYPELAAVVRAGEPLQLRLQVIADATNHELDVDSPLREGHVHAHQLMEELVLSGLIEAHASALAALRAKVKEVCHEP